jgi:hypothetical protein
VEFLARLGRLFRGFLGVLAEHLARERLRQTLFRPRVVGVADPDPRLPGVQEGVGDGVGQRAQIVPAHADLVAEADGGELHVAFDAEGDVLAQRRVEQVQPAGRDPAARQEEGAEGQRQEARADAAVPSLLA